MGITGKKPGETGTPVVLPSSFIGGPRHMFEIYQDSMVITRFNHHPDIFLTMTANPNWRKIRELLLPHQQPHERPDLTARIFELKRKQLMKDIQQKHVLGKSVAHVYTIEFQKRGLPHMHALIFLAGLDKIQTKERVDRLVHAEFPDEVEDPALFNTVKRCMVQRPCRHKNPTALYMDKGKCTKGYPKSYAESTSLGEKMDIQFTSAATMDAK